MNTTTKSTIIPTLTNSQLIRTFFKMVEDKSCFRDNRPSSDYQVGYLQSTIESLMRIPEVRDYMENRLETMVKDYTNNKLETISRN